MNVRVYMLAKEFELGNQTVMNQLGKMGYKMANHMALVSDDIVKAIRKFYADDRNWDAAQAAERAEKEKMKPPRRRIHKAAAHKKAPPAKKPAAKKSAAPPETAVAVEEKPAKAPAKPPVKKKRAAPRVEAPPEVVVKPEAAPPEPVAPPAPPAEVAPPQAAGPAVKEPPAARPPIDTRQPTVRHKPKRAAVKLGRIDLRMPVEEEPGPEKPKPERPQRPPFPRPGAPFVPPGRAVGLGAPEEGAAAFRGKRPKFGRRGPTKVHVTHGPVTPALEPVGKHERRFIKTFAKQKLVSRQKIPFLKERVPLGRIAPLEAHRRTTAFIAPATVVVPDKFEVELPVTVKDLAAKLAVKVSDIIRRMMMNNKLMIRINDYLDDEIVQMVGMEFGKEIIVKKPRELEQALDEYITESKPEDLVTRAPVIAFLGHVDHGKTSLLDRIRKANVAAGEAGGITQHIGAYHVKVHNRPVVFLDTPGHEAFTMMRARGARVTDIVVLVVAADDGVMPQTKEAIDHARAANVPIIVAINKIDKPNANPERVKRELADLGLVPEEWGGQTIVVELSAKKRQNLDLLLEMVLLVSDIGELKASPKRNAMGTVLEAKLDKGRGPVATLLVQDGTLRVGDTFIAGPVVGKVRALIDDRGRHVKSAGPSIPVEVLGLGGLPQPGDPFQAITDTAKARQVAMFRQAQVKEKAMGARAGSRLTLESLKQQIAEGEVKELPVIIKADVQGSAEVLADTLVKLSDDKVKIKIIHSGVGSINESDVLLASASNAIIIGFDVRPDRNAGDIAEREHVDIRLHSVIYNVIDEMKKAMTGLLEPALKEQRLGIAEVRNTFKVPKFGTIAGCMVTEGRVTRSGEAQARLLRDNQVVFEGKIGSLRRFKDDVSEVKAGFECGVGLERFNDIKVGDVIEVFTVERVAATVS